MAEQYLNQIGLNWALVLAMAVFAVVALLEVLLPRGPAPESGDSRLLANFSLGILAIAATALVPFGLYEAAALAVRAQIGLFQTLPAPAAVMLAAAIAAQSLAAYWLHRACHRFPLLWRIHAVHHSDRVVDVSTGLRNHPLEHMLVLPVTIGVILLLGLSPRIAVAMATTGYLAAFWQHAAVALPVGFERRLGKVLVTPALHHLHHAEGRDVHDSNYGDLLIVWDRVFGTYRGAAPEPVTPGLAGDGPSALALPGLLLRPFRPIPRPAVR